MRRLRWALLAVLILLLNGCVWWGGSVNGQVLDKETKEPVADAFVVVLWNGQASSLVHSQLVCIHAESARSDSQGNFRVKGWIRLANIMLVSDIEPSIRAYKVGYGEDSRAKKMLYLAPFTGNREARFEFLKRMVSGTSCDSAAGESRKNLFPILEALYREADSLAVTPAERKDVLWFREMAGYIVRPPDMTKEEVAIQGELLFQGRSE